MNIRALRKEKGLTIVELANELGVPRSTLASWEVDTYTPSVRDLEKLSKYFGVGFDTLFGRESTLPTVVEKRQVKEFPTVGYYKTTASLEELEKSIEEDLEDVKFSFFQIGYKLKLINETELYKQLGHETIIDYAEARFGFGKSTTYNFINVYDMTCDFKNKAQIKQDFKGYNYSQLTEMTRSRWACDSLPLYIEKGDKVSDIKRFISIWNKTNDKGLSLAGETLREVLTNYDARHPKELPSAKSERLDVAPGQMSIDDYESIDSEGKEEFFPAPVQEPQEISEPISSNANKQKFYSTPAKIKEAVKDFLKLYGYKVIFDPDNTGGGIRIVAEEVSTCLTGYFLKNWNEIFDNAGVGISN